MISFEDLKSKKDGLCIVGLGYVGLPLAVELSKHFRTIGFDIKKDRIAELEKNFDRTREVSADKLRDVKIEFTFDPKSISQARFIIVAVPTPVDKKNLPDLSLVERATETVGANLAAGSIVVYESTVYPGVTEDICLPILEKLSGLRAGIDFKIGYSPERINPGDKEHTINKVIKVVAGMDEESLNLIDKVYGAVAPTFRAASIKVAEAAKVIENTQRDLNIALMNELAIIFSKMNVSVYDVLAAAGTKWNFLKFTPGLVGGHCIGVDPYYLTHKSESLGYKPEVILAGRHVNDSMGGWITEEILKNIKNKKVEELKVLIAGMTFKENVPDIRNSKVFDIYNQFLKHNIKPYVCDPIADREETKHEYGIELYDLRNARDFDLVVVTVAHHEYRMMRVNDWKGLLRGGGLLADIKGMYNELEIRNEGLQYWGM